jgi:hypothetical protein
MTAPFVTPGPGQAHVIEPGHDAWVVGDEPVVAFEFDSSTAQTYARTSQDEHCDRIARARWG